MGESFGKYVSGLRTSKGIYIEDLASILRISARELHDIENDELEPPSYDKLCLLSKAMRLSPNENTSLFTLAGNARDKLPDEIKNYVLMNRDRIIACLPQLKANLSKSMP